MSTVNYKIRLMIASACLLFVVTFASAQDIANVNRSVHTKHTLDTQSVVSNKIITKMQRNSGDIEVPGSVIFLIRHFEKKSTDANAKQNKDPELTTQGQARAQLLASFLADKNVTTVFSTNYKRTIQTATPTAKQNGSSVTFYNPRDLADLALQLQAMSTKGKGNILIVGHSNTTPQLLKLLGGPDKPLSENDYGDLFYLTIGDANQLKTHSIADSFQHVMIE
nr:histidine phosphatase family protein [uncultured Glaciecola sp.]